MLRRSFALLLLLLLSACLVGGRAGSALRRRRRTGVQKRKRPIIVSMGSARVPESVSKATTKAAAVGRSAAGNGSGGGGGHRHAFTTKPPFHQSAYHGAPIGNLDTEELTRRTKMLIAARQREIQGEMNATVQQMRSSREEDNLAFKERAFEEAETVQQLQTHHLPGMDEKQPDVADAAAVSAAAAVAKRKFDPRKDPLWRIVMRKKRTGSAYKAKQRADP